MSDDGRREHLRVVPSAQGYELFVREGDPPAVGVAVEEGGRSFRVAKLGSSPLPHDRRRCAYLQPD